MTTVRARRRNANDTAAARVAPARAGAHNNNPVGVTNRRARVRDVRAAAAATGPPAAAACNIPHGDGRDEGLLETCLTPPR